MDCLDAGGVEGGVHPSLLRDDRSLERFAVHIYYHCELSHHLVQIIGLKLNTTFFKNLKVKNLVGPRAPCTGLLRLFSEGLLNFWKVGASIAGDSNCFPNRLMPTAISSLFGISFVSFLERTNRCFN